MFNWLKKLGKKEGILLIFLTLFVSLGVSFLGNIDLVRGGFFTNCTDSVTGISQVECEALESFYDSTDGDNWTNNTNWGTNTAVNTWHGVSLSGGHVRILILDHNNLTGTIPSSIGNLSSLTRLSLNNNNLTGTIPSQLGNINTLERLYLDHNNLTGGVPPSLGNLPSLERLYLDHNNLIGSIPITTAGTFSNLTRLRLGENNLTGTIPTAIGNLTNLQSLYIENNKLTGSIPTEIGNMTSLTELWLDRNQLSGNIPTTIGNLTGLTKLFLNSNKLTGLIPTEIGTLVNLDYLNLADNQLNGIIPNQIGNLVALQNLYLNHNQLDGPLPTTLANLTQLIRFYLNNNKISGNIPNLTGLPVLSYFSILNNNFVFGDFETEFATYSGYISFSYTPQKIVDIERTITTAVSETLTIIPSVPVNANDQYRWYRDGVLINGATDRVYTKITHAEDAGIYTYEITNTVVGIEFDPDYALKSNKIKVVVSSVCLNGALSISQAECTALESIYDSLGGLSWTDSTHWKFATDVNTWHGVTVTGGVVTQLNLSNNILTGNIPSAIGVLTHLTTLNLGGNNISGAIPTEIQHLAPTLTVLDVNNNKITGTFSTELLSLTNLTTLYLYGNNFTGLIPNAISNLSGLVNLGLSANSFSGEIPSTLWTIASLKEINLSHNQLMGSIPTAIGGIPNLTQISLANNHLEGGIPVEIGNLGTSLTSLDLSNNNLTGNIPAEISSLTSLTSLLLSNNNFFGNIDPTLLGLTNLINLSLGGNNLSGDVPNFSTIGTLANIDLHDNNFVFADFESEFSMYSALTSFLYAPQKKVDQIRSILLTEGETFKIIPQVGLNPSGNDTYKWYKDGVILGGVTNRIYQAIAEPDDEGVYVYTITNSTFVDGTSSPTLTLTSEGISVYSGSALSLVDCKLENITGVPESECLALKDLFNTTNGENWTANNYWGRSTNIGLWYGVTVEEGHVTSLELPHNNLDGLLPDSIVNLTGLKSISLEDNTLYGSLPSNIGNLVNLTKLDLSGNALGGGIPSSIGNLSKLTSLILSNNVLTGTIPTQIGGLTNLEILYLDRNKLSCDIPNEIVNLTKLLYQLGLQLYSNNLNIPVNTSSALSIFLQRSSATGTNHFTNQNTASCEAEELPPKAMSLSKKDIDEGLASGSLVGYLSASDPDSTTLVFSFVTGSGDNDNSLFQISGNQLRSGTVFNFENKSTYSVRINVSDGTNNYAKSFEISINDIQDNEFLNCTTQNYIPTTECQALVDFYNALDGGNSDLNWKTEADIKDWNNLVFEMNIAQSLDRDLDGLPNEEDPKPTDPCVPNAAAQACNDRDLDGITDGNDGNKNDPCVPSAENQACRDSKIETNVTELSGQYLNGKIPSSIKDLIYLKKLKLDNNNNISGNIPSGIGTLKYLEHLLLANNRFVGSIPTELSNLSNLITLSLSRNKLSGTLPSALGNLSNLHYLYVFDNAFSCYVPDTFSQLHNLVDGDGLRIHDNHLIVPKEGNNLFPFVTQKSPSGEAIFSLQRNPYCGEVPTLLAIDSLTIDENKPIETVVGNLSTQDEDDTVFTYSLVAGEGSDDNNSFKIIGSTLVSTEIFDYETKKRYLVRINTNDGDNNLEKAFEININDVNLPPTDIYLSSNVIPENQILKTLIGNLTVEDDGESTEITYSLISGLGDTDNSSFNIEGDKLRTNKVFDFEVQSVFSIRVNVNDGSNNFSKVFIITISLDKDGDGIMDVDDTNPNDACIPNRTSLACLSLDRDGDHVADGSDQDPNDPCIPDSGSVACRNKWGPLWDQLYGDGPDQVVVKEKEVIDSCGQSCRYAIERYEGGYFTGATGKDGAFRAGDSITYVPPEGHALETYYVNYGKIGIFGMMPANQSFQIKPGYINRERVQFPIHVKNGNGKWIVILRSPAVTIDNKAALYREKGVFVGSTGEDGAFMEGDAIRYLGPSERILGHRFEVDLHPIGFPHFLEERRPYLLRGIKPWYGKYLDVYITAIDRSGNESVFLGPRIWFGSVDHSVKEEEFKPSAPRPASKIEEIEKIPQYKKSPFFRPEDGYDMVLKEKLKEQVNQPKPKAAEEKFDLRKDLEEEFETDSVAPVIKNPFPAKERFVPSLESRMLQQRLSQQKYKPSAKKPVRFDIRDYIKGLK